MQSESCLQLRSKSEDSILVLRPRQELKQMATKATNTAARVRLKFVPVLCFALSRVRRRGRRSARGTRHPPPLP